MVVTGAGETFLDALPAVAAVGAGNGSLGARGYVGWGFLSCHRSQRSFTAFGVLLVPGGITRDIWFVDNVQFSREVRIVR